ncbi:TPA_asm: hypothetical protein GND82_004168 [Salmonella enterica subsp. salamae serovar 60:g,m,t:z6]|uniref:Uncharacterized protein n=1 Tax=Salmonella enterica subsp. houtenae serovar 1,40:z4,z32:- TaxID=1967604 RepID=A0A730WPL5_SALHO|nr:hypothetical protein [Salmonella enterica]HAE2269533.1 hypothetical protein [Salmonella enterica subsp. enterica serovar 1,9,12:-:-]HAE4190996.1 hypothetical protein [Salmonella enterica subsp. houtenae serovar 1,40:z4,z32:-]HAE7515241.1 hypothetical protein [Salmonella enterica subsp. salamae serovar 60:g,m,t:z6]
MKKSELQELLYFFCVFSIALFVVFYGVRFCKKNNIDMNTFSGMLEMYRRIFMFENKYFSILMLVCIYGGALLGLITFGVSLWAETQGCVFPTRYS